MLPKYLSAVKRQKNPRPVLTLDPSGAKTLRIACAVILITGLATLNLGARKRVVGEEAVKAFKDCESQILKPGTAELPDNLRDATKAALTCEWLDSHGVVDMLKAMQLLVSTSPDSAVSAALADGDPNPGDEGLFAAAMSSPSIRKDLLAVLAKSNTLTPRLDSSDKETRQARVEEYFNCTLGLIKEIYGTADGKTALVQIDQTFIQSDPATNYKALYELLNVRKPPDPLKLEAFRAAFKLDANRLASQVHSKIVGSGD
jgi:hypothetical protein